MANKIEKERRWLLKRVPIERYSKIEHISQFYTQDGWRYRITQGSEGEESCIRLKKIPIGNGINHEIDIEEVTEEQLEKVTETTDEVRWIEKIRYTLQENGLTFEVDEFEEINLVILEVEDVDVDDVIDFPQAIKDVLITEITGQSAFSNYNLADTTSKETENLNQNENLPSEGVTCESRPVPLL